MLKGKDSKLFRNYYTVGQLTFFDKTVTDNKKLNAKIWNTFNTEINKIIQIKINIKLQFILFHRKLYKEYNTLSTVHSHVQYTVIIERYKKWHKGIDDEELGVDNFTLECKYNIEL